MIYKILATGSDGNATIVNGYSLIDCGVPYKAIEHYAQDLRLVFLTHIHGDHFNAATIKKLAFVRPSLRWVCCEWLVEALLDAGVKTTQIDVIRPGAWVAFEMGDVVYASPIELTHNVRNCGWRIVINEESLFYATDTGTLEGISVKGYDVYLVEANHTQAEIEAAVAAAQANGEFTYRLRAAENHLSEEQARDWLTENMAAYSVWVPMHGHREGGSNHAGTENAREEHY